MKIVNLEKKEAKRKRASLPKVRLLAIYAVWSKARTADLCREAGVSQGTMYQ